MHGHKIQFRPNWSKLICASNQTTGLKNPVANEPLRQARRQKPDNLFRAMHRPKRPIGRHRGLRIQYR